MSNNPVVLQFTQDDRDMLRDTHALVKEMITTLKEPKSGLEVRVDALEEWKTRVIAICAFAGFLAGIAARAVWK